MRLSSILPFRRKGADDDTPRPQSSSLALESRGFARAVAPARYADFLPDAQAIAAREHSPFARILLVAIAFFTVLALVWAALASVDKVATAPGRVRPDSQVKIINHAEGGRIQEIFVTEGQRVTAGAPLVSFDPEFLDEEVSRLREEWMTFAAQAARLEAESINSDTVVFPENLQDANPTLLNSQRSLFQSRRASFLSRQNGAEESVIRFSREADALRDRISSLEETVEIRADQEDATRQATERGYYSRLRYLTIKNELVEAQGQLATRREDLAAKEAQKAEAEKRREQVDDDYHSEVLELLVQNLTVTSSGQAVNDNEPLMNVIPTGDKLIIEARVSNNDIGFIELGQEAEIRVNTYDFVKFGTLKGKVTQIAGDASEDPGTEASNFNYVVLVRTDRTHLGPEPTDQPVLPGMQVTADFKLGTRTILSFLTDRVSQTAQTALRER